MEIAKILVELRKKYPKLWRLIEKFFQRLEITQYYQPSRYINQNILKFFKRKPIQCLHLFSDPLLSPPSGSSAADRFSSPSPGSAKRRLFSAMSEQDVPGKSGDASSGETPPTQIIAFQHAQTEDGKQVKFL